MYNLNDDIQFDENVKTLILEIESKNTELESKVQEIDMLKNEIEYLRSVILNKNKKIFGKSSEKFNYDQLSLFNEAETYCDPKKDELEQEEIKYTRNKPSKKKGKKDTLANLKRVIIHHNLEDDKKDCDNCSSEMECIGTSSKEILKYKPAELTVEEHITHTYACKERCEDEEGKTNIISTKAPSTLLHKSMASNEILSHIIALKYVYALPLYRQESYFKMLGLELSRQTLSNWIVAAADEMKLVYEVMKEELLKRKYIQADETTLKVLEKSGDESRSKHYMWLYRSGTDIEPIILYEYQKTRSGSNPRKFLDTFKGYLQADGYSGYNAVVAVDLYHCLAHIRRKFHEIITPLSEDARKESIAYKAFIYCEKLYEIEKHLRKTYKEEGDYFNIRYKVRLEKSAPLIDEFIDFLSINIHNALGGSSLGRALVYAQNHIGSFRDIFLKDGSLEIDNNASERAIKNFVIGRKNWLFCKNKKGAESSSIIYSIIETARANNLMVEKYLIFLIDTLSNLENYDKNILLNVMPWSKTLPEDLRIPTKDTPKN